MTNYDNLPLHDMSEKLVDIMCKKTQNNDPMFFRILLVYYFSMIASHMRCSIKGFDSNTIPINAYVINLSPSGTGKGYSSSFIERDITSSFKDIFLNHTFPTSTHLNIDTLANKRSRTNGTTVDHEIEKLHKEFDLVGPFLYDFDSATVPAVKQHRHKLLLANAGSLNFRVDEIGANLQAQIEVLHTFLELYDLGLLKEKLIKSSTENKRLEKIDGGTPTNMLLFGTPSKLLDGGKTEELFFELLEMGFARRSFFGLSKESAKDLEMSAEDMVNNMFNSASDDFVNDVCNNLAALAHESNLHKNIKIERPELIQLMEYRLYCEKLAKELPEQQGIQKAELSHRYFKALKLAGVYAFLDYSSTITADNLNNAIALTQLSGKAFDELMKPEKNYMKLAKYLATTPNEVVLADLVEDLPYFKGTKLQKEEMINLAIGYGYKNNIIIKQSVENGIMFLKGEALEETKEDSLLISISNHFAYNYEYQQTTFEALKQLGTVKGYEWTNHAFLHKHRKEDNVIPGFNVIVLDVDGGTPLKAALEIFKGIKAVFYTTKSYTEKSPHYRIIIPINYTLYLEKDEYKEFMTNIMDSIPLITGMDDASKQRSKKWETHEGTVETTDGELFNVLPYIPQTSKNEERIANLNSSDLNRLQNWILANAENNRNNKLYNYACILHDSNHSYTDIRDEVIALNNKLNDPLSSEELENTVLRSIASKSL